MERSRSGVRRPWRLAAFFMAAGTLVPWLTGLGVKLWLDSIGRPTYPISDFLDPVATPALLAWTLVFWAFPFVILGALAVAAPTARLGPDPSLPGWTRPLWAAFVAGVALEIPLFLGVFWEWDTLMLLVPLGGVLLIPMAAAYLGVWWWMRRRGAGVRPDPGAAPG